MKYKDTEVSRDAECVQDLVGSVTETKPAVTVLTGSQCRDQDEPVPSPADDARGPSEVPWALRSGNRTYVAEISLDFIDENDSHIPQIGPVAEDTVDQHVVRMKRGRLSMSEVVCTSDLHIRGRVHRSVNFRRVRTRVHGRRVVP